MSANRFISTMSAANSVIGDLCSWIAALPSPIPFPITTPSTGGRSILLSSDCSDNPAAASTTFSISLTHPTKTLWISEPIPCSAPSPHLLLLLQLLHEAVAIPPHALLPKPDPARLLHALGSSPDTATLLFLALLCHLFRLCSGDSPADAGLVFFGSLDAALPVALNCRPSLGAFLFAVGADWEELFMRSVGHMVAKWCILGELSAACQEKRTFPVGGCLSYAVEVLL